MNKKKFEYNYTEIFNLISHTLNINMQKDWETGEVLYALFNLIIHYSEKCYHEKGNKIFIDKIIKEFTEITNKYEK